MKSKPIVRFILFFGIIMSVLPFGGTIRAQEPEDPQAAALNQLREDSRQPLRIHFDDGIPKFASFEVPVPSGSPSDPVVRALSFLEKYRDLYLLQDPRSQLFLDHIVTNELGQHVFFGQRRDELPVLPAQIAVHLSEDAVIGTNGNYLTEIPLFPTPVIDETRAEQIALDHLSGGNAQRVGEPKLVYFNARLFMKPADISKRELDANTHQAWQLTLQGDVNIAGIYFIDTQNGAVLFRLNVSPGHGAMKDLSIRTANNTAGWLCTFGGATDWFDENGLRPGAFPDAEGNNAFNSANQVYDFYFNNFHRHSWNGSEGELSIILDDSGTPPNATYDGMCKHFIFSNNFATLDVIAHEFTHGVTNTAGSANLWYADQPGALNESYSDVFAALIDNANFTIGEGAPGGPFRSISNPPLFGDPDVMSNFVITTADNGGVHTNSGIPNKVAFLLMAGGTHNGITVNGIGRPKTAQLYYEVLTSWLILHSDFNDARFGTVFMAQWYANHATHGFTNADVCDVGNAFASVGIGLPDQDCDGIDDTSDPLVDVDGDTIGDSVDNCPLVSNPGQGDTDKDGKGDTCDTDNDNDGVLDSSDNCPLVVNSGQADKTSDGFGDVCQDTDFDSVLDSVDNCLYSSNSSQSDFDKDGMGDTCDQDDDNDGVNTNGDNCPLVHNPSQTDSDSDGYGDACDSCPATADTPFDSDKDGINDACDPDDDNDGIPDITDNCPIITNSNQQDLNGNGIGHACDPDEIINLGASPDVIQGALQFRKGFFEKFQVLILPDLTNFGRDWIPEKFFVEVKVQLDIDLPMQIVDDQGFVMAQSSKELGNVMRLYPNGDFFYRPPNWPPAISNLRSEAMEPYQGRQYFLEIFPTDKIEPDRDYKIRIEAVSGIDEVLISTEPPTSLLRNARIWLAIGGVATLLILIVVAFTRRKKS